MLQRTLRIIACLLALALLAGCGGILTKVHTEPNKGAPTIPEDTFSSPILLTSAGQSADVYVTQTLLWQAGLRQMLMAPVVEVEALTDRYGTLVLAVGGSAKGMGVAGINFQEEYSRVERLVDRAVELDIPILAVHLGGQTRRGEFSDPLIRLVLDSAAAAIVLSEGDWDDYMLNRILDNGIPVQYVDDPLDTAEVFHSIFTE